MRDDISALTHAIATGALTATALVTDGLRRIDAHDEALHAILAVNPRAVDEAQACDAETAAGRSRGPLHGIPLVVKDNIDVAGLPTTSGCKALAGAMPHRDAAQVARLRDAGAVIVAKANLSEFSFEIRSRSSLGGDTINPFRAGVTSGGSSGGTAVAVAAGFAAAGLGTDTGGSIRVPAAFNGLVGLRPTHGRLALDGVAPLAPSTDTIGPIARSVDDAALLWAVMSGRPSRHREVSIKSRRIGVLRQACGERPEVLRALDMALAGLGEAGVAVVDPVLLPVAALPIGGAHIVDAEFGAAFDAYLARNFVAGTAPGSLREIVASGVFLAALEPALRARLAPVDAAARAAILDRHAALRDALAALVRAHRLDALIHPTSIVVPEGLGNPKCGWGAELAAQSGRPAISVPAGVSDAGIPIGVELLGAPDSEPLLLALAGAIERAAGPRVPPFPQRDQSGGRCVHRPPDDEPALKS